MKIQENGGAGISLFARAHLSRSPGIRRVVAQLGAGSKSANERNNGAPNGVIAGIRQSTSGAADSDIFSQWIDPCPTTSCSKESSKAITFPDTHARIGSAATYDDVGHAQALVRSRSSNPYPRETCAESHEFTRSSTYYVSSASIRFYNTHNAYAFMPSPVSRHTAL